MSPSAEVEAILLVNGMSVAARMVHRKGVASLITALVMTVLLGCVLGWSTPAAETAILMVVCVELGVLGTLARRAYELAVGWERATVRVNQRGVFVNDILLLPREKIRYAHRQASSDFTVTLFLSTYGRIGWMSPFRLALRVPESALADDLLAAAGIEARADRRVAWFHRMSSRWQKNFVRCSAGSLAVLGWLWTVSGHRIWFRGVPVAAGLAIGLVLLPLGYLRLMRVEIGHDGIHFRRWLRARFIPYIRIERVVRRGADLALRLSSGEELPLYSLATDEVLQEIEELVRVAQSGGSSSKLAGIIAALQPQGRTLSAWLAALRSMASQPYRAVPAGGEALRRVLEDSAVPAQTRVAAAFALRVREGDDATPDLHRAAIGSASPMFRIALESVERRDDIRTESCLAELAAQGDE